MSRNLLNIKISPNRIYGLDILRALAIIFVVHAHGGYLLPVEIKRVVRYFVLNGVSIFFVLSGFLIGGILIKLLVNNAPTNKLLLNFWCRRWFRTLPNYFLILIILLILSHFYTYNFSIFNNLEYFLFLQNLYTPHPWLFPEAWSLSVEEWFYIIMPLGIFTLLRLFKMPTKTAIIIVATTIIISTTSFRFFRYLNYDFETISQWDRAFRKQVITRLDSLMFGVIGAYLQFYWKELWQKYKLPLFAIGLVMLFGERLLFSFGYIPVTSFYKCVLSFSVVSFGTLLLLPFFSSIKTGKGILHRWITTISLISYSMYLIHYSLINFFIMKKINLIEVSEFGFLFSVFKYSLYWFLTIAGSILLYKYFEIPTTNLRDSKTVKRLLSKIN